MKILALSLVCCGIASAAADEAIDLARAGLVDWREPAGAWLTAGGATPCPTNPTRLVTLPRQGVLVNRPDGRTVNLLTRAEFGDVELHVEFMSPARSNSGVYLMGRYDIQIYDSHGVAEPRHSDCGGIYQRWANHRGFEGRPPSVNAARPAGEWQTSDIVFRAPRFDVAGVKTSNATFVRVAHNGVVIHENAEVSGATRAAAFADEKPTGPLMLQGDHGPIAYRNLRIRPRPSP